MNEVYNFPFSVKENLTVTEISEFKRHWIVPAVMLEVGRVYRMHLFEDGSGYIEEVTDEHLQYQKARIAIHRAGPEYATDRVLRSREQQRPKH